MLRLFRYLLIFFISIGIAGLLGAAVFVHETAQDLPDYEKLEKYEPAVMTRIYAANGDLLNEYAIKRRLYLPSKVIPDYLKAAFISAEDKNFYKHHGVDPEGLLRAVFKNLKSIGKGKRPEGASTITQQVAKNFLLNSKTTLDRKVKEALLAFRIEKAFSKDKILELYLNEIYLGRAAYGIAAAALTYFNKSVDELTIAESAFLASLPKGPSNYDPYKYPDRVMTRRNWVLDRMHENGYISQQEALDAKKTPLGVVKTTTNKYVKGAEYFSEEVRRRLLSKYGIETLYQGGLSVRTTLEPKLQEIARRALHKELIFYDQSLGWRGAYKHVDLSDDWGRDIAFIPSLSDVPEWQLAVILKVGAKQLQIGLQPKVKLSGDVSQERDVGTIGDADMKWAYRIFNRDNQFIRTTTPLKLFKKGDVIFVKKKPNTKSSYALQQIPEIQGSVVVMEPHTGRVLAMVGGFSFAQSQFNRATQAYRQPGSSFKPFVYAAALDNGYTPASVIYDGPVAITQENGEIWRPKNYGGDFSGASTLRSGIEKSKNLMTVRLANDLGMPIVAEYAEKLGVYDKLMPVLSMSLGAGDTTVLRMVSGYSVIVNGGRAVSPSFIDRIQDRYGHTNYRDDKRRCDECNLPWLNQKEPELIDDREQILDPATAYQVTSMLEGVIERGTGRRLKYLKRHIAGKTGTTNDSKDAWFIGFTPNIIVGVYIGYDQPRPLGLGGTGAALALPVFDYFIKNALKNEPNIPFQRPDDMRVIAINQKTGMRVKPGDNPEDTILESFRPGTGPSDVYKVIGSTDSFVEGMPILPTSEKVQDALKNGENGLY